MTASKDTKGKPPLALLPYNSLAEVAKVFEYGAKKYKMHDWRQGHKQLDMISASLRHTYKYLEGNNQDEESGLEHLAHAATNLLIVLQQISDGNSIDDRYKK